jgi:hypothetical protein
VGRNQKKLKKTINHNNFKYLTKKKPNQHTLPEKPPEKMGDLP